MKKITAFFSIVLGLYLLAGCSNILEKSDRTAAYGNLTVGKTEARAINVQEIAGVECTVSGYGFSKISGTLTGSVSDGKGIISFSDIPVGSNRIVTVSAKNSAGDKITDIVLTAVVNINQGENTLDEVNWATSIKGNIYSAALSAGKNISDSSVCSVLDTAVQSFTERSVHASMIDTVSLISAYGTWDFTANTYVKTSGTVEIKCSNINGQRVFVSDPNSAVSAAVSSNLQTVTVDNVLPGTWNVYSVDGATYTLHGSLTVESGSTSLFTIGTNTTLKPVSENPLYGTTTKVTDRIVFNVPVSLGYSYIYAWTGSGAGAVKLFGDWPGSQMTTVSDGFYVYDCYKDGNSSATSFSVIFNNGSGGSAGNGQTADLSVSSAGAYEYKGGAAGTGTSSDWTEIEYPVQLVESALSVADNTTFYSASLSVTASAVLATTSKYTVDGSDPASSSTAVPFSSSVTFSVGDVLSANETVTVRVYADDGEYYHTAGATYKKVEKPSVPERLGAYYTSSATCFSIWSPDNSDVVVSVKKAGESTATDYTCTSSFTVDGGYPDTANIYGVSVQGDLHLAEYQFKIGGKAVRDPYGVMINNTTGFNVVINLALTELSGGWAERPVLTNREDSIVYEVHVRDFTIDENSGVDSDKKGKFPGMVQTGTSYGSLTTGIDHLKELGITHVQILPMYDFATTMYNWGYDPVNYNIPEEQYSACPDDSVERIKEVKNMINEFHKNGIRVIMDVVYNHTYGKEMFKDISGKYYTATDLSGCGNSVNSGIPMVSRFIRDSLEFWADEYNIDGFRFDLVGIFHRDAVKEWGEYLNVTKFPERNILMYGEPWNGYATDSEESAKVRYGTTAGMASGHVGVFNGKYREEIKGDNDDTGMKYMFNNGISWEGAIAAGMRGSIRVTKSTADLSNLWDSMYCYDPEQSINYISAHDNLCLWDKILKCGKTGDYAKRIDRFGMGIVVTSQGIPFIHAGDEFLRTKAPDDDWTYAHNSYNAPDKYNKIRWAEKQTNESVFDYYKDLIALRKSTAGMRLTTWDEINSRVTTKLNYSGASGINCVNDSSLPVNVVVSIVDDNLAIVYNPGDKFTVTLPSGSWTKVFDITGAVSDASSKVCEGTAVTVFKKN